MRSIQKVAFLFITLACCFSFSGTGVAQDKVSNETDFASELMSTGQYEAARRIFLNASEKSSDKKTADSSKIFSTLCLFYMNDKERFINDAKEILAKDKFSPDHLYALKETLANAFVEKGNFDEAGVYFLAASEDPQASFDQQVNSKISVINCLFLGGKKDEFLKNSQTFLDEFKNVDVKNMNSSSLNSLNNLRMTVGDVLHNNYDWQKARNVYLQVDKSNLQRYINARARSAQSLYFEGDCAKFEEEFVEIAQELDQSKGTLQSKETEELLLNAGFSAYSLEHYDASIDRLENYISTSKYSREIDVVIAKVSLGISLLSSVTKTGLYKVKSAKESENLYDRRRKALDIMREFLEKIETYKESYSQSESDNESIFYISNEVYFHLRLYDLLKENAQEALNKAKPKSYFWAQQMLWLGIAKTFLEDYKGASETFEIILIEKPEDRYPIDHISTHAANWLMRISYHLGNFETALMCRNWIEKNGIAPVKKQAEEIIAELWGKP